MNNLFTEFHRINPNKTKFFKNTWMSPTFETILLRTLKTEKITVVNIIPHGHAKDKLFFRFHGDRKLHFVILDGNDSANKIKERILKIWKI